MNEENNVTLSHIGICVSDYERSVRFYTEALGFSLSHEVDFKEPFDLLTQLPGLNGHAGFLHKGTLMVELIHYRAPEAVGPAAPRPMNQLGLTHIAIIVADLDGAAQQIENCGGAVLRETRVSSTFGDMMFATDPDGTRLELWEKAE
jgi:predicted enzyme related to lactoylglutathione lyase